MAQQKLYTEFEVKSAMDIARCQPNLTFDEVLEQLTPIELPSMAQQTAVEWLEQEIRKLNIKVDGAVQDSAIKILEQAKQMEREQIENAYWDGGQDVPTNAIRCEEYYTKTFGK